MDVRCAIVDDNAHFLESARGLLERQGITIVGVATNSADALRLVTERWPDVMLIDIALGDEYGFDLINEIESYGLASDTIMVCISTYAEEDFTDALTSSAVVGFLSKHDLSGDAIREIVRNYGPSRHGHQP